MANQDELFDFNEEQKQLQKLIDQFKVLDTTIMKVSADALTAGRNINAITLPSDLATFTAQNAQLTATIQAQARELARLQAQYNSLSTQRQRSSTQTAEEAVNQRILNRNAMEAARINSTLAGAYGRLSAEQGRAARTLQDLIARGRLATQTQREYDRELRIAQREFSTLNDRVLAADRAVGRFNRNVGNYPAQAVKGLKDLLAAFGLVGGLQLAANIAKDIFETTKEIQSLDLALKQVVQTNELFAQSQSFLSRISEAYGANINDLTKQFTQFYVSAKDKISGREIEQIFESITKAGATMGLSQQQQERAFLALNQMMSKGTIQAEELRGQLGEALPGALGIMAKSLGVTEKQLGQMMKDGKLLASEVLPKFAKQLEITYGIESVTRVETLAAAQGRLSNSWIEFVRTLNESEAGGVTQFFSSIMAGVNWLLQGLVDINKSLAMIRTEFINEATSSTLDYLNAIDKVSEREAIANLTRKDAIKNIGELNEKLAQLNHEQALLDEIKPLNFLPSRILRLKEVVKEIEEVNASLGTQKGRLLGAKAALDQLNEKPKNSTDQAELTKAQLKAIEDALKARYDAAKKELELQALKQEVILNGELTSYKDQEQALEKWLDLKMKMITLDYNEQVRLAKGNKDKIRAAEIDAEMATIKQMQDGYTKIKNIRKKQNDEYIAELKEVEAFLKEYHDDEEIREQAQLELKKKVDDSENELYLKKQERLKELKQATKDYLKTFVDEFASNSGFENLFKSFDKDNPLSLFNKFKEGNAFSKENWKSTTVDIMESAQEMYNFINNASQRNFDAEKERLQSQYDIAFGYANGNKEAEEKLATDLENKKKEIANREAKAKKQQAIYNIAIDTAQAIVASLPNLYLAAAVAVLGAVQIGIVSSQKIPQYFKGGTHDGGLMMVNDAPGQNFKETIVFPNGGIAQPEGRDVLMNAPRGTKIYTPDQWEKQQQEEQIRSMLHPRGVLMHSERNNGFNYEAMDNIMNKYLGNVTVEKTVIDKDGFSNYVEKQGSRTKINRAFASSKGFKFK